MILKEAKKQARRAGFTLSYHTKYEEYVVYPIGSSFEDPIAYFTMDIQDAVDTAIAMGARG